MRDQAGPSRIPATASSVNPGTPETPSTTGILTDVDDAREIIAVQTESRITLIISAALHD